MRAEPLQRLGVALAATLLVAIAFAACAGDDDRAGDPLIRPPADEPDAPGDPSEGLPGSLGCNAYLDDWQPIEPRERVASVGPLSDTPDELRAAVAIESLNAAVRRAIGETSGGYGAKLDAVKAAFRDRSPDVLDAIDGAGQSLPALAVAQALVERMDGALGSARAPAVAAPSAAEVPRAGFSIDVPDEAIVRYWLYSHWSEILSGFYDDSDYAWVYGPYGRSSFLDEEVGARGEDGVEMFMDWWRVATDVWTNESMSDNAKLMAAKYAMFDDPHWGLPDNPYWRYQPAFKDEDCALFTGNMMGALAFEYSVTRHPRTLARLKAIVRAYRLFDRFTLDSGHPLDQEGYDGRIQRGTMTKNLYFEDELNLWEFDPDDPFDGHHNNSAPDRVTGRERKNVSRDQYYGLLLGYYATWQVLSDIPDRTPAEEKLYCDVVIHLGLIVDYLFFSPRVLADHPLEYNVFALVEGSTANPPNLTFMVAWSYGAYERITGRDMASTYDAGNRLVHSLFTLGGLIGGIELSQLLFDPAQSGLTALNQYMVSLYMSDLSPEEWQFIYPPEVLVQQPNRRTLWRRVIALFAAKYGRFGNDVYRSVLDEMLAIENNPAPRVAEMSWNGDEGFRRVEPQGKLEDFLLPLATIAAAADNREALGAALVDRYDAMVAEGAIDFAETDLPYGADGLPTD